MHNFEFVKPATVADAVVALRASGAQALSGGMTLLPTMKARLAAPDVLVSLNGIAETRGVCMDGGHLVIGGATTHAVVAKEAMPHYPALAELAGWIGDPAVRNRGTIGGSLANNDPSACYPAAVLASGATIVTDRRRIAADDYFRGMFTTALADGEIIIGVHFPVPEKAAYIKFEQPASRFALTGVFLAKFRGRGAGRGDGGFGRGRVPLDGSRECAFGEFLGGGGGGAGGAGEGDDRRSARIGGLPGEPREGADGAGGDGGEVTGGCPGLHACNLRQASVFAGVHEFR